MHSAVVVFLEEDQTNPSSLSGAIDKIMTEQGQDASWEIGGRWTGFFDGYDPTNDPANVPACSVCNGKGANPRLASIGLPVPCEFCRGKGKLVKWPGEWVRYEGDACPASVWRERLQQADCYPEIIITPDGRWHEDAHFKPYEGGASEGWRAETKELVAAACEAKWTAVIVDMHW